MVGGNVLRLDNHWDARYIAARIGENARRAQRSERKRAEHEMAGAATADLQGGVRHATGVGLI